ncbi:hypothetical protein J6590_083539 [Homalodisca vitripennis]|nr:hypothetical protein J6590_083539 [Homalodisca vitripennis]
MVKKTLLDLLDLKKTVLTKSIRELVNNNIYEVQCSCFCNGRFKKTSIVTARANVEETPEEFQLPPLSYNSEYCGPPPVRFTRGRIAGSRPQSRHLRKKGRLSLFQPSSVSKRGRYSLVFGLATTFNIKGTPPTPTVNSAVD